MDEYEKLIAHVKKTVPVTEEECDKLVKRFKVHTLGKKEHLLRSGEVSHHMRFIVNGCLRAYYIDDNSEEHTLQFGIQGWWINDLYSYLTHTAARQSIQTTEPSTILQIHRASLDELFNESQAIERFFRLKMQKAYVALQERTLHQLSLNAKDRYLHFRNHYREIEQKVPQYMVASYLGITPEFLSELRKKIND